MWVFFYKQEELRVFQYQAHDYFLCQVKQVAQLPSFTKSKKLQIYGLINLKFKQELKLSKRQIVLSLALRSVLEITFYEFPATLKFIYGQN